MTRIEIQLTNVLRYVKNLYTGGWINYRQIVLRREAIRQTTEWFEKDEVYKWVAIRRVRSQSEKKSDGSKNAVA